MNLELHGTDSGGLVLLLLAVISATLALWGAVQLVSRRWHIGAVAIAAAGGPLPLAGILVFNTIISGMDGDRRKLRRYLILTAALTTLSALAILPAASAGTSDGWWMSALIVQIAIAVGVFYSTVYAHLGDLRMAALIGLRVTAIVILMLLLFKPALMVMPDLESHTPPLVMLVDRSGSMSTIDSEETPDRYSRIMNMLRWQKKVIDENFDPHYLHFASDAKNVDSLDDLKYLTPRGQGTDGTDIRAALSHARATAPDSGLVGIIMLTDGIDNGSGEPVSIVSRLGVPVHTVMVGSRKPPVSGRANIRLVSVDAPLEAIENNTTEISARIDLKYFKDAKVEVRLLAEGKPVASEIITATSGDETAEVKLKWIPQRENKATDLPVRRLKIEASAVDRKLGKKEFSGEDNFHDFHVLITNPKIRLLCIEGTMRPEYKYLRRLLQTDPNIQFMGMIRVSKNRFWAQGSVDGKKLQKLPETDADFGMFDVIIIGDLDSTFLSAAVMEKYRKFVNHGGGLLMIGGRNSLGAGGYGGTPIEMALPVISGPRSVKQVEDPFLPRLTASGENHPILTGIKGFFPGPGGRARDTKLAELMPLLGMSRVNQVKPGAALLAVHPDLTGPSGPLPVLAVQRYGKGRSGAFCADTTWRWYLPLKGLGQESPYARFWGQMIRWLAHVDVAGRELGASAVLRLDRSVTYLGEGKININASVRDAEGQPATDVRSTIEFVPADGGATEKLPMEATAMPGMLKGSWKPAEGGDYNVKMTAVNAGNDKLGTDSIRIKVIRRNTELQHLALNDRLLVKLAEKSGGKSVDLAAFPDLLNGIIDEQKSGLQEVAPETHRLFHFPALFILFVVFLTGEWLLRRYWQLQ